MNETTMIPDGKGGWVEVEMTGPKQHLKLDEDRRQSAYAKAVADNYFPRISEVADKVNKYVRLMLSENAYSADEILGGLYLEMLNHREFHERGQQAADEICQGIWGFFMEELQKEKNRSTK